jgi:hypothetical protein
MPSRVHEYSHTFTETPVSYASPTKKTNVSNAQYKHCTQPYKAIQKDTLFIRPDISGSKSNSFVLQVGHRASVSSKFLRPQFGQPFFVDHPILAFPGGVYACRKKGGARTSKPMPPPRDHEDPYRRHETRSRAPWGRTHKSRFLFKNSWFSAGARRVNTSNCRCQTTQIEKLANSPYTKNNSMVPYRR